MRVGLVTGKDVDAERAMVMLYKMLGSREGWVRKSGRPSAANMERQLSAWAQHLMDQSRAGSLMLDRRVDRVHSLCHIVREMTGMQTQCNIKYHNG